MGQQADVPALRQPGRHGHSQGAAVEARWQPLVQALPPVLHRHGRHLHALDQGRPATLDPRDPLRTHRQIRACPRCRCRRNLACSTGRRGICSTAFVRLAAGGTSSCPAWSRLTKPTSAARNRTSTRARSPTPVAAQSARLPSLASASGAARSRRSRWNAPTPPLWRRLSKTTQRRARRSCTDDAAACGALPTVINQYQHDVIRHGAGECVRGAVHTNGIEAVWAALKRSIHGTWHHVSPRHLGRHVSEATFRLNEGSCEVDTLDRMEALVRQMPGTRLRCKDLIADNGESATPVAVQ